MSKSPVVKSSEVQYDGAGTLTVNTGKQSFAVGAVSRVAEFIAPCDLTVVRAELYVGVKPTSANAKLNLGIDTDSDAFLNALDCNALTANTLYDVLADSTWITKTIPRGSVVSFELEAATAVGDISASFVFAPTSLAV
jgi:hypothetical protein